jgi:hypothetical protein
LDPRLAILNGFGRTLGDSIIGLQALHAARMLGRLDHAPVLFRLVMQSPVIEDVYALAGGLAEIRELPWSDAMPEHPFAGAAGFARVLDLRDFAFDPAFRGVAMIDYFLRRLGLDPRAVPPALRRNSWLAPLVAPPVPQGYVLLCPNTANRMRDMPDWVHALIRDWLTRRGLPLRSQAVLSPARTLDELCALVGGARLVVSADTAMVHLADAMGMPCLAFFTTHDPVWRVRDYPLCTAVHLRPEGLPPALEFPRGAADIAAAEAAWGIAGPEAITAALAAALG